MYFFYCLKLDLMEQLMNIDIVLLYMKLNKIKIEKLRLTKDAEFENKEKVPIMDFQQVKMFDWLRLIN